MILLNQNSGNNDILRLCCLDSIKLTWPNINISGRVDYDSAEEILFNFAYTYASRYCEELIEEYNRCRALEYCSLESIKEDICDYLSWHPYTCCDLSSDNPITTEEFSNIELFNYKLGIGACSNIIRDGVESYFSVNQDFLIDRLREIGCTIIKDWGERCEIILDEAIEYLYIFLNNRYEIDLPFSVLEEQETIQLFFNLDDFQTVVECFVQGYLDSPYYEEEDQEVDINKYFSKYLFLYGNGSKRKSKSRTEDNFSYEIEDIVTKFKPKGELKKIPDYLSRVEEYLWLLSFIDLVKLDPDEFYFDQEQLFAMIIANYMDLSNNSQDFGYFSRVCQNCISWLDEENLGMPEDKIEFYRLSVYSSYPTNYYLQLKSHFRNCPYEILKIWITDSFNSNIAERSTRYEKNCLFSVTTNANNPYYRINPEWNKYLIDNYYDLRDYLIENIKENRMDLDNDEVEFFD